ncbi:MAG: SH3 domain-containing protein, partial [Chloroflexota bacterium]
MKASRSFCSLMMRVAFVALVGVFLSACDALATDSTEEEPIAFEGAPDVILASPLPGDTYNEGVGVNILLRVDNAGPDIGRIAIAVDGVIIGEAVSPNGSGDPSFTVSNSWPASGEGEHTITATATRTDGTTSGTAEVTINVLSLAQDVASNETDTDADAEAETVDDIGDDEMADAEEEMADETEDTESEAEAQSDSDTEDTAAPTDAPTEAPQPTVEPTVAPTNTPSVPQVRVITGANVRSGPGLVFDPPIGSLAAGATANILAVSTSGTWYRIDAFNSGGWIADSTVEVIGNTSGLPREAGPPTPIPASPLPPTNTPPPPSAVDLAITGTPIISSREPTASSTFFCGVDSDISVTIVNQGTERSAGTTVVIEDLFNGQ